MGTSKMADNTRNIGKALNIMRNDMLCSDLTFICQYKSSLIFPSICLINAHQAVLGQVSKTLKRLFRIAREKQPYERVYITVDSFEPIIVEKLVEFIYEGKTIVNNQQKMDIMNFFESLQLELKGMNVQNMTINSSMESVPESILQIHDTATQFLNNSIDISLPYNLITAHENRPKSPLAKEKS